MSRSDAVGKGQDYYLRLVSMLYRNRVISLFIGVAVSPLFRLFRQLWVVLPSLVRASAYDGLLWIDSTYIVARFR